MPSSGKPFPQNVIAVIWDFDKTLISGNMQAPLFRAYGVDEDEFWDEVNTLPAFYAAHGYPLFSKDTAYLSHILTYVKEGKFDDLSNKKLRELGAEIEFFPGLPDFFRELKETIEDNPTFAQRDIKLEHYIVSTGLRQMVHGSRIDPYVEGVWACELLGVAAPVGLKPGKQKGDPKTAASAPLTGIAYAIDNTTKTRAVFEINKGVNMHSEIDVNARMAPEARRVPFEHMIYIADGPSDVPVFSVVKQYGGRTFAVYPPGATKPEFRQVMELQAQERVLAFGPADYQPGTHTHRCLTTWAEQIAEAIAKRWQTVLGDSLGNPPTHLPPEKGVPTKESEAPAEASEPVEKKDVDPSQRPEADSPPA